MNTTINISRNNRDYHFQVRSGEKSVFSTPRKLSTSHDKQDIDYTIKLIEERDIDYTIKLFEETSIFLLLFYRLVIYFDTRYNTGQTDNFLFNNIF